MILYLFHLWCILWCFLRTLDVQVFLLLIYVNAKISIFKEKISELFILSDLNLIQTLLIPDLCAADHTLLSCSLSLFFFLSLSHSNPSFRAGSVSCCVGKRIPLQRTGHSGRTSPWSAAFWACLRPNETTSMSRRAALGSSTTMSGRPTWCTSPATSYRWAPGVLTVLLGKARNHNWLQNQTILICEVKTINILMMKCRHVFVRQTHTRM